MVKNNSNESPGNWDIPTLSPQTKPYNCGDSPCGPK